MLMNFLLNHERCEIKSSEDIHGIHNIFRNTHFNQLSRNIEV